MTTRIVYVDTSAFASLLLQQTETQAMWNWLESTDDYLVSSDLLETELRQVAIREQISQTDVTALLDGVQLVAVDRPTFRAAGLLPMPYLRSLDALHLESAMHAEADAVLTLDHRLQEAARAVGLDVIAPGQG